MSVPSIPSLSARDAVIPAIGLGTSGLSHCGEIVATALKLGYRHIDTAWKYGTERGVGEGMRASGVPRSDIFLCTKVSHEYLRADDFARSVDESLANLNVDYVDLLLVHWPNAAIPLKETMAALAKAKRQGLPAISGWRISISRCWTKRSRSARSRWSICRARATPISIRQRSSTPAAGAASSSPPIARSGAGGC